MPIDRDIARGLLKIHLLAQAAKGDLYGLAVIERFAKLGVVLSPGTLYPTLKAMVAEGDLRASAAVVGGRRRLIYRITRKGRSELAEARTALVKLGKDLLT